jgi:hypothetical protein
MLHHWEGATKNSEYLAQRRKDRKEIKRPDLAFLAAWREQIPVFASHWPLKSLRKSPRIFTFL